MRAKQDMNEQNIWEMEGFLLNRQMRRGQVVKHMLKNSKHKLILDIGCSEGFITSFLSGIPADVIGVDVEEGIEIAKDKVKDAMFIYASITRLPFRDEVFEAITLLEVLEHLKDQTINESIKEVDRVLKLRGNLIISVPYKEKITFTQCIHCGKQTPLWGHIQTFDENRVTSLLPKSYILTEKRHLINFELISCSRLLKNLPYPLWVILNNLLGLLRKGYWIVCKYKKFR